MAQGQSDVIETFQKAPPRVVVNLEGGDDGAARHQARLEVNGPDDAWNRFREVIQWYGEVRETGGYREYYSNPARGTLQGGR